LDDFGVFISIVAPLLAGALGVAVGWGALRTRVNRAEKDITELKDDKVWTTQCTALHGALNVKVEKLSVKADNHGKALGGLQNFARWILAKKEGLSLTEVNKIINGG
jgi:hypothetical protein